LAKAHNDLLAADAILAYYEEPPTDTVCYHAQQVAEKCFKAFYIAKTQKLKKIHDLNKLLKQCIVIEKSFEALRDVTRNLNRYFIDAKYPAGIPYWYPKDEAKVAVDLAREILAITRKKLTTEQPETSA
jgi:HEPN domain-containing protein